MIEPCHGVFGYVRIKKTIFLLCPNKRNNLPIDVLSLCSVNLTMNPSRSSGKRSIDMFFRFSISLVHVLSVDSSDKRFILDTTYS